MADLFEVLGTVLKDITHSRVLSDVFSRDVSVEYEDDDRLRMFPVPRLDIKEANINLKFAVNTVEEKSTDPVTLVRPHLKKYAIRIATSVYKSQVANKDEVIEIIAVRRPKLLDGLGKEIENVLAEHPDELKLALEGKFSALEGKLNGALNAFMLSDAEIKKALLKGSSIGAFRKITTETTKVIVRNNIIKHALKLIESSKSKKFALDVAVTRDELADISEAVLSNITVTAEIQNYEWTQVDEVDGKPVRNLVRE